MLACVTEAAAAYHVPVPAIKRVLNAAKGQSSTASIGPMGIPAVWMPVLGAYGFSVRLVRGNPCWGIAAGAWILAVERMEQGGATGLPVFRGRAYPTRLGSIPAADRRYAQDASRATGVPASLLLAVAAQESGFDPDAVSNRGAQGLMQFIPATWSHYGRGSPFNPKAAMLAGAKYLRHLALEFHSWRLALAAYNAGGGAVRQWGGIPPYQQTQEYVPAVLSRAQAFSGTGER